MRFICDRGLSRGPAGTQRDSQVTAALLGNSMRPLCDRGSAGRSAGTQKGLIDRRGFLGDPRELNDTPR
jgi:hypothetical protein